MLFPGALYIDGTISEYISIYYDVDKTRTANMLLWSVIFSMTL